MWGCTHTALPGHAWLHHARGLCIASRADDVCQSLPRQGQGGSKQLRAACAGQAAMRKGRGHGAFICGVRRSLDASTSAETICVAGKSADFAAIEFPQAARQCDRLHGCYSWRPRRCDQPAAWAQG